MQTTFLNAAGVVLFARDDMEQGNWTQEEYTVNATFPFVAGKVIERGQRLSFRDPATGSLEMFEVRNVTTIEPEHYQQIIAEHIAVSELSDEHINAQEITDQTPAQALATALTGTLWAVGNLAVSRTSSVDISRGSVWQAVNSIAQNWNVYIVPRVTVNAAGAITGRYLDVTESTGVWRGLRLSIDKNMSDASVVYDDSETLTALYGYGGSVDKAQASGDDTQETVTFADEVWTETADHPAKPSGQTYLEDPQATALYGRNGRPRFGFYQNGDIKDGATLLEKTWEALKQTNKPKISITGTVADLYRLGYKDQPVRLHDLAIVDIPETGESFYLQIIRCDVDLIDPTATRPEIGSYIANIIYINRESNESSGGGGGGRGQNKEKYDEATTYSAFEKTNELIGMVVGTKNGQNYIKAGEIALSINSQTGESKILLQADVIDIDGLIESLRSKSLLVANMTMTENAYMLGSMTYQFKPVAWKSQTVVTSVTRSGNHYFLYASSQSSQTPSGSASGTLVTAVDTTTINYLGMDNT
jgi:phage minor structural protein